MIASSSPSSSQHVHWDSCCSLRFVEKIIDRHEIDSMWYTEEEFLNFRRNLEMDQDPHHMNDIKSALHFKKSRYEVKDNQDAPIAPISSSPKSVIFESESIENRERQLRRKRREYSHLTVLYEQYSQHLDKRYCPDSIAEVYSRWSQEAKMDGVKRALCVALEVHAPDSPTVVLEGYTFQMRSCDDRYSSDSHICQR